MIGRAVMAQRIEAHDLVIEAREPVAHETTAAGPEIDRVDPAVGLLARDPRDVGVSLWHHRMRVEPGFAEKDQKLDEMILGVCRAWPQHLEKILALQAANPSRIHIVRYEDLISTTRDAALAGILDFLILPHDPATLGAMFEATDFNKLKKKEEAAIKKDGEAKTEESGFFRSGKRDGWRDILTDTQKAKALESSGPMLEKFKYDL